MSKRLRFMLSLSYIKFIQTILLHFALQSTGIIGLESESREINTYLLAYELQIQELDHWEVVLAQAVIESGWTFNSKLFRRTGNFCGMRVPGKRKSMRVGIHNGYSAYNHWKDCVTDVKLWQKQNWKEGTREQYLDKLSKWAEAPNYREMLNIVLRKIDRDKRYKLRLITVELPTFVTDTSTKK